MSVAKFTLLGSNSGRNAGDAAILASIMGTLSSQIDGDVEFEVPTTNPGFVSGSYGKMFNVKPVSIMPWTGSIRLLGIPTFRSVKRTDVTMITDGIIFDINLWNPLFNFLITLIFIAPWARLFGKKLVCYSVGIGPLNSFFGRLFAKYVGNSCDLIIVRDKDSLELFRKIGVKKEIHLLADAVFQDWPAPDADITKIIKAKGLEQAASEGRMLGFNITRYIDRWLASGEKVADKGSFVDMLARALAGLKHEENIEPVIVTTQVMDAEIGRQLQQSVARAYKSIAADSWEPAIVTNEVYSNHEILGFSSKCSLYAGMRLHSLIIAAQSGTPIVGLIYAPKVKSFLNQLNTPERGLPLAELTEASLKRELSDAWKNRGQIEQTQQEVVRGLRDSAKAAGRLVAEKYFKVRRDSGAAQQRQESVAVGG
ncbi:MAG: polysaccharide pyruvyl transferase family protein [Bdellovibrionales bacterium]|nr:polysaccharide pyruvyl transferase family protein [Bdellovibrionales bacterium]